MRTELASWDWLIYLIIKCINLPIKWVLLQSKCFINIMNFISNIVWCHYNAFTNIFINNSNTAKLFWSFSFCHYITTMLSSSFRLAGIFQLSVFIWTEVKNHCLLVQVLIFYFTIIPLSCWICFSKNYSCWRTQTLWLKCYIWVKFDCKKTTVNVSSTKGYKAPQHDEASTMLHCR